jgi:hypothetical protein
VGDRALLVGTFVPKLDKSNLANISKSDKNWGEAKNGNILQDKCNIC